MLPLRRGGGVMLTEEDELGNSKRHDFKIPDWLKLELSSPRSSPPAPAAPVVVETPPLLAVDDASPRACSSRSFPLLGIPQPPPEIISSSLPHSSRSFSIARRKKAKRESSFRPSTTPGSTSGVDSVRAREGTSARLSSTSPGFIPIGGLNEVKQENSSSPPSSSPGCIPIVGRFSSSPSSSPDKIPYVGCNAVMEEMSLSPSISPGSIPIGVLNEVKQENSLNPSSSPGGIPIIGLSGAKRKFSNNPSTSPGDLSVVVLPKPSSILNSHLSTSPGGMPVDGLSSSRPWSHGHAAVIAALNRREAAMQEYSSHISTSQDSMSVAEHIGMMKETPLEQVQAMEVTVLEPPPSKPNNVYKKKRKLERHIHLVDLLPDNILVIASQWRPPTQHEEELRQANSRQTHVKGNAGARKTIPPVLVGSAYHAIEEIYSKRLDADAYAKYGLFHDRESVWFRNFSEAGPPPRPVAKKRKPYKKAALVSRLKS